MNLTRRLFLPITLAAVVVFAVAGCTKRYVGDYGGGGGGNPTVFLKSDTITIAAETGTAWEFHEGKIEKITPSQDGKSFRLQGNLAYGRGVTQASYEAGLTGNKEIYDYSPFTADVDTAAKTVHVTTTLRYAGSLYAFDATLKKQ